MMYTLCLAALLGATPFAQDSAQPEFQDGEAQVIEAFKERDDWVQHDLWVETEFDSDGDGQPDRMHVDVTRQMQTDTENLKVPVIYESSPYYSGVSVGDKKYFWDPSHELGETPTERPDPPSVKSTASRPLISRSLLRDWLPRGFAVVHSESPGTGLSDGCPTIGAANETLAPKAVIDWLCGRAKGFTSREGDEEITAYWCTGKVGMTGVSYNGTLALAAATTGVEGLEAIIPIAPNTSYYNYYRANGLVRHPGGYMGEDMDVLYNFIHSGEESMRDHCNATVRDADLEANIDRETGDWSDFWKARDLQSQLGKVKAATLVVHGFNDWNVMPSHSVKVYEALRAQGVPAMAYFHQRDHTHPSMLTHMNRWFSRYLYDVPDETESDSRAWIVREGDSYKNATAYADYPNPAAEHVYMSLGSGGGKAGVLGAVMGAGFETLVDDVSVSGKELASAAESPNRLLYVTPELKQPLHISGTPRIRVRMSSSTPAANLSVWLVSLPWTDSRRVTDNIITRGWADPQNRGSIDSSKPLVPGELVDFTFELEPDDQIIPVGAKMGLMLFSSDRDFTLWPEPGTELTFDLAGTLLELPVVGGRAALESALAE